MLTRVGICSQCGGDVVGYRGSWHSISPPPPDQCSQCGAYRAGQVIEMTPSPTAPPVRRVSTVFGTHFGSKTNTGNFIIEDCGTCLK